MVAAAAAAAAATAGQRRSRLTKAARTAAAAEAAAAEMRGKIEVESGPARRVSSQAAGDDSTVATAEIRHLAKAV